MSDAANPRKRRQFFVALGLALVAFLLVGPALLFPIVSRPVITKARRVDSETAQIQMALRSYHAAFGVFPDGDSSAVFRALRGQNPRRLVFLSCRAGSVSAEGSMLDPWGAPYKLDFSGKEPVVRSVGPNKQFDRPAEKRLDDRVK